MMDDARNYGYSMPDENRMLLVNWLVVVAFLVFCMVVLGGVTRLTNSGLSMVEWKPVTGWLPPLSEQAWMDEFEKYKAFPEYQKINKGMSLDEFKGIFAFEYAHRVLGRIIGLAFFVPLVLFALMRTIPVHMLPRLLGLLVLGGSQGVMGWIMVKSGLVDHPDVSHYRLTAHLGLASLILAALVWTALEVRSPAIRKVQNSTVTNWSKVVLALVFLQILVGGFVAGLNAGFVYNDWPTMGGGFVPDDIFYMTPWYLNFVENVATIQFTHRLVAYLLFGVALWLFYLCRRRAGAQSKKLAHWMMAAVVLQIFLGIWTLISVVPVSLGAFHQAGGMIVLISSVMLVHSLTRQQIK